ncbi:MAG: phenylalanine--tRNA ligase subunit beta [Roseibacillus sp.]|nr:phenylalanine--tRNA ligase subunit beta [Roseibacillus sp.]
MLISKKWLNSHLDVTDLSNSEFDDVLTFAGVEVEGIIEKGVASDLVVVAEVVASEQHPNADRLSVTRVDAGEAELRQIVCGAKNYKVGDKVPCALPGAVLPGGFEIKETVMRKVESRGMLCSAIEVGLGSDHSGLMILPAEWQTGKPLRKFVDDDTVFEIEVTPNRPDLLSHYGMAREVAALTRREIRVMDVPSLELKADTTSLSIEGQDVCALYTATRIKGVKVSESPAWLKDKLEAIGLRPINNIVDVTNFVLHEVGHPLHAFDAAEVDGGIRVRYAKENESFAALDEQSYTLAPSDCVISDESGNTLALGGVMGGETSSVTTSTTEVILESAWFDPPSIRKTARRLNLHSDSSYRFERGVDPQGVNRASALAVKLITELAGGVIDEPTNFAGVTPEMTGSVSLEPERLHQTVGGAISIDSAHNALERLGLLHEGGNQWKIPSYRMDLQRHVDLVEEIVRVNGLDSIPSRNLSRSAAPGKVDARYDLEIDLKKQLAAQGFFEAQSIKLISEAQLRDALPLRPMQEGDVIRVRLPLSEDHSVMRPSLSPALLSIASRNVRQGAKEIRFFEMGRCFRNAGGGKATDLEADVIGIILGGRRSPVCWQNKGGELTNAFDLKGILASLLPGVEVQLSPVKPGNFLLNAQVVANGKTIGSFAQLSLSRGRELNLGFPVYLAELDLNKVCELRTGSSRVKELPQFPGSSRDAAMEVPSDLSNTDIEKAIQKLNEPLLVSFGCFDVFRDPTGEQLDSEKKSLAYTFHYRSDDKTVTSKEVDNAHQRTLDHLSSSLPVSFR